MSTALHLPLPWPSTLEQRRAALPLITELVESAGLSDGEAENVARAVMRTALGYLPEPLLLRVRGEMSSRLRRGVGFAVFPYGNRFADPDLFFEQVARATGLRVDRAKALSQAVMGAWSRTVTPSLLRAVAGYMPKLFRALVPARSALVVERPRSPLEPGDPLPLCTAPNDGRRWHKTGATFGRVRS